MKYSVGKLLSISSTLALLVVLLKPYSVTAQAGLGIRYDKMSDSVSGSISTHEIGLTMLNTTQSVGSIAIEFCSNSPVVAEACVSPGGFDISGASLASQSGDVGFSIHPITTNNRLVLTRIAAAPTGITSVYTLDNVQNPIALGTHFLRITTYSSVDASGTHIEEGGAAINISEQVDVSSEVEPWINFCAGVTIVDFDCTSANSYFIDFGFLTTSATKFGSSQLVSGSNAEFGYSITMNGTTLTSGSNTIAPMTIPAVSSVGSSQFGLNLRSNTVPNIGADPVGPGISTPDPKYNTPNQYAFGGGDIIVSVGQADYSMKFTISYITNIDGSEPGGVYATTLSYICLANF